MARHWRGVAFPNGATDLVKSTKLALSDDLRSLNLERGPVFGGDSTVALHILHIHIANGHHLPLVDGSFEFSYPLSVLLHPCEIATLSRCTL